jgi:hypothetical protein
MQSERCIIPLKWKVEGDEVASYAQKKATQQWVWLAMDSRYVRLGGKTL